MVVNRSIITGGEFANTSTVNCTSSADIYGGAFKGIVNNHGSSIIRDGTFEGTVDNTSSEIQGGTFNCKVENGRYGTISGGTFNDVVFNGKNAGAASTISGGEFTKDSIIINKKSGIISGGNLKGKIYYSIKIASSDNGNVVVDNVDPFNENAAMAGDIVTLTVEPDAGYILESIVAAMPNGSAVEIDAFEDDAVIYQFTMPASVVTITSTFASVANIENDTLYVSGRLTELPEGTYTKIQVDSKSELALEGVTVTQDVQNYGTISGGTYTGNVTNYEKIAGGEFHGNVSCDNGADITDGTFRGPVNNSGNSTISGGTFWNVVSNRSNSDIQNGIFHNGVENSSRGNISGGTFYGPVTNGSNAGAAATISGGTFENDVTNRKSGIIEGNPTFNRNMYYGINIYPSDNGNVVTNHVDSFDENAARAGDTVTLTVEPEEGYELATLTIIDADENPVEVRKTGLFEYQFTMPARAITAKTSFNKCILVYFDNNGPKWENVWAICYDENDVGHSVALTTDMCQDGVYTVYAPAGTVKIQFQNQPPLSPDKPLKTDIVDIQEETTYTYTQKDFVVTFDANGGKGTMAPQTFVDGQEQKLSKNLFGRSGYMFVRWNTKANGTGISYADEQVISLTENITLYAQWAFIPVQLESYIVCFDANGGEGMMNAQMFYKGLSRNLILNRFVREGYTFDGWNTEPDGKGQYYGDGWNITVSKDMTLYAQWKQNPPRVKPEYKIEVNGSKGTITRLNDTSLIYEDMYIRYAVSYIIDGEPYMVVDLIKVKWEKTQKGVIGTFSIPNLHSSGKITNESFLLTTNDNANKVVISDVVPNSYGFLVQ